MLVTLLRLLVLLPSFAFAKQHSGHHVARRHPPGPPQSPVAPPPSNATVGSDEDLEDVDFLSFSLEERGNVVKEQHMPNGFHGTQTGLGSWFQANSGRDSTNGNSWCGIHYQDNMPLFAPKFGTMSPSHAVWGTSPSQWKADASRYCGLQAELTYGKRKIIAYIGDAFDDRWVRTPGSVDILKGPWTKLYGRSTSSKDVVMQNVKWRLTGKRSKTYSFKG